MDMNLDGEFVGGYSVNLTEVVKNKDVMAVTKLLAHRIMENPYLSVGEFMEELSDLDLDALQDAVEKEEYSDVILIGEMLATAEGCDQAKDFDEMMERSKSMAMFLTITSLGRKGLVKVHYDKLSFHPDSGKNIVVERIDGLDYQSIIDKFK
jgi:hypothetical protein